MRPLFCALLFAVGFVQAAEPEFPLVDAQECRPRAGWPNFLAKAQGRFGSGALPEIKVGYLGGPITAQPGWRVKSLAHFKQAYPSAKFTEINAAIGGTGSDLGVFRVQQDVLSKQPDLLFVEFAVNDGGASPEQIIRCMEGIVRQTWRAYPECDIVFVYTIAGNMLETTQQGKLPRSVAAMEDVATHYGIPSIHAGRYFCDQVARGEWSFRGETKAPALLRDERAFAWSQRHPCYVQRLRELGPAAYFSDPAGCAKP